MYTGDNIYNFFVNNQCCLGVKGSEILSKLKTESLCKEDKINFILAHIFNQLIILYNVEFAHFKDAVFTTDDIQHNIKIGSISIGSHVIVLDINANSTWESVIGSIIDIINQVEGIYVSIIPIQVIGGISFILEIYTEFEDLFGETVQLSFNDLYIDGVPVSISSDITFTEPSPSYGCISDEQFCNMVNFLKKYCTNQNNCLTCRNT